MYALCGANLLFLYVYSTIKFFSDLFALFDVIMGNSKTRLGNLIFSVGSDLTEKCFSCLFFCYLWA